MSEPEKEKGKRFIKEISSNLLTFLLRCGIMMGVEGNQDKNTGV
jgi:hypothetical protein